MNVQELIERCVDISNEEGNTLEVEVDTETAAEENSEALLDGDKFPVDEVYVADGKLIIRLAPLT